MRVRKERTFYDASKEEAEALAAPFIEAANGKIFYSAPVLSPTIGDNDHKKPPKWQVDAEYYEEKDVW